MNSAKPPLRSASPVSRNEKERTAIESGKLLYVPGQDPDGTVSPAKPVSANEDGTGRNRHAPPSNLPSTAGGRIEGQWNYGTQNLHSQI